MTDQGEKMTGQKPKAKFAAGTVSAALWENEVTSKNGQQVTLPKATVERRYKDSDGTWKSTNSYSRNEIPLAIYCLQKAFEAMINSDKDGDEDTNY